MTSSIDEAERSDARPAQINPLVVVTLNTWKGDGEYSARLRSMSEEVRNVGPDILLLQECFTAPSIGLDTAASLAAVSDYRVASWLGRSKVRTCEGIEATSTSGLAVLSRHPIVSSWAIDLPSDPRDGDRAALFAEINHRDGVVLVVSLHLTHLRDGDALRRQQFDCVVNELRRTPASRVIVGGDFNATPDKGFMTADLPNGRLVDSRLLSGATPTSTLVRGDACIDHILMLAPAGRKKDVNGVSVTTAFDRPDPINGVLPSDHFGVRVTIA